jgi:hypothetical protein
MTRHPAVRAAPSLRRRAVVTRRANLVSRTVRRFDSSRSRFTNSRTNARYADMTHCTSPPIQAPPWTRHLSTSRKPVVQIECRSCEMRRRCNCGQRSHRAQICPCEFLTAISTTTPAAGSVQARRRCRFLSVGASACYRSMAIAFAAGRRRSRLSQMWHPIWHSNPSRLRFGFEEVQVACSVGRDCD